MRSETQHASVRRYKRFEHVLAEFTEGGLRVCACVCALVCVCVLSTDARRCSSTTFIVKVHPFGGSIGRCVGAVREIVRFATHTHNKHDILITIFT